MAFTAKILSHVMAFSPPEYCRLFAQKKAYQGGVTGTPGPSPPHPTQLRPWLKTSEKRERGMMGMSVEQKRGLLFLPFPSFIHDSFILAINHKYNNSIENS